MLIEHAQQNMKHAYFGGAPGVLSSGLIWLFAGAIALVYSQQASMLALFFGGMLIHPLAIVLSKTLQRPGHHQADNPLGKLALESTVLLFIGLFIAFNVAKLQANWFFPIMLMVIGGRYLLFATLYGMRLYWLLAGLLAAAGMLCMSNNVAFALAALSGGAIELIFALIIFAQAREQASVSA